MNEREVRLPPYKIEKVAMTTLLKEMSNWGTRSLLIEKLWQHTKGEKVKVCVLDTGCSHKDIPIHKGEDFTGSGDVGDRVGHGNWCAGCMASIKGLGIAPKCELYVGKILRGGMGAWTWLKKGLEWALEEKCQVISISAGGDYSGNEIQPILKELSDSGVLIFAAAGNENDRLIFPANSPYTIAVGAVNKKWERARFSNFGPRLVVMGPGVDLLGCWLNNGYAKATGTSMSNPFLAGIGALEKALRPMNIEEAIKRFAETSRDIGKSGFDEKTGHGIIEPHKFLQIKAEEKKSSAWVLLLLLLLLIFKVPITTAQKLVRR